MNARRATGVKLLGCVSTATTRPNSRTSRSAIRGLLWIFLLPTWARSDSLTVTVPQGLSTIANPFNYESNLVSQVLTRVPEGTQLYKFNAAAQRWQVNQFQLGAWAQGEQTLAPGEGAFIRNPSEPFSITLTGTPTPTNFVASVSSGYNLLSEPAGATIQLNPKSNDSLRFWDPTRTNYSPILFSIIDGTWIYQGGLVHDPPYRPGESFFYYRTPAPEEAVPQVQFSVYLNNYIPASGVDVPISSSYGCFGSTYVAQLYEQWSNGGRPVGEPIPLLASAGATYIDPKFDAVRIPTSFSTSYQIRVWDSRRGNSLEEAEQRGFFGGRSEFFVMSPPTANLQPPVNLVGMQPFWVGPLTPYWPIPWSTSPTNAAVVEGQSAQFQAEPFGRPIWAWDLQTYQWQRETLPNTWTDIPGETSSILRIPAVQKADAGRYRVAGQFDCKSDVSLPSVLTVLEQPRLDAALMSEGNQNLLLSGIGPVQIEVSYDLSHWTNFAAGTNGSGRWEVLVTNVSEFAQRFFRVRPAP